MTTSRAASSGTMVMEASTFYALDVPIEPAVEFKPLQEMRRLPDLAPEEFFADGADGRTVVVYARRRGSNDPPAKAIRNVTITRVELGGDRRQDLALEEDLAWAADPANAGTRAFRVRPVGGHSLLATAERLAARTVLAVEIRATAKDGGGGWFDRAEFPVRPIYPYVRLWVVGGAKKGTSVAGAFACLPQKGRRRLAGLPLQLWTESNGSASLTIESGGTATDAKGLCSWVLKYAGLSWDALAGTRLRVNCGLAADTGKEPVEWTRFEVLPYDNVVDLLEEIGARRYELELTNPGFQPGGDYPWPSVAPALLRGPAYNAAHAPEEILAGVGLTREPPESDAPYLCKYIRNRIYRFMESRRFGGAGSGKNDPVADEAMPRMNGIEICAWEMAPVHVWAGIHLSGSEPDDDPRYIDPWWYQEWSADTLSPIRLISKWEQTGRAAAAGAMAGALMVAAVYLANYLAMKVQHLAFKLGRPFGVRSFTRIAHWLRRSWRAGARPGVVVGAPTGLGLGGGAYSAVGTHVCDPSYVHGRYIAFRDQWLENRADHLSATAPTLVVDPVLQRR